MGKRVNNHKGWPSKNKANNRRLRNLRADKQKLHKLRESLSLEDKINFRGKELFNSLSRAIKAITPKRFNRTR